MTLFELPPPLPQPIDEKLSPNQRITRRNNALLGRGLHPITKLRLLDDGSTCGKCSNLFAWGRSRTYWKCKLNATRGLGTDVRKRWPACTEFKPIEKEDASG